MMCILRLAIVLTIVLAGSAARGGESLLGEDVASTYGVAREFDRLVALLGDDVLRDIVCRLSSERYTPARMSAALGLPEGQVLRRINVLRRWGLVRLVRRDSATTIVEPRPGGAATLGRWAKKYCPMGDGCGFPAVAMPTGGTADTPGEEDTIKIYAAERHGSSKRGGFESRHTFSYGAFHDPDRMGFGPLRVINEHRVKPGARLRAHEHRDTEIITFVLRGAYAYEDDAGNHAVIGPGEIHRLTAGTGVRHMEYNPSKTESLHFLRMWITPRRKNLMPSSEHKPFSDSERRGRPLLLVSGDGRDGSVKVHRDVNLYSTLLDMTQMVWFDMAKDRFGWIQVVSGIVKVNGRPLATGDGAAISGESELVIIGAADGTEILFFDMK